MVEEYKIVKGKYRIEEINFSPHQLSKRRESIGLVLKAKGFGGLRKTLFSLRGRLHSGITA